MYSAGLANSTSREIQHMKVTQAQAQANRAHILETASRLFRERGFDGVGIADLMAAAGFTHGGFYKHFESKADLMAQASRCGFAQGAALAEGFDAQAFATYYLSRQHRDNRGEGCTMAALSADAARQTQPTKEAFAAGVESMLQALASRDGPQAGGEGDSDSRARRIEVVTQAVGALVMSRACPDDSPLADEILEVCLAAILSKLPAAHDAEPERPGE